MEGRRLHGRSGAKEGRYVEGRLEAYPSTPMAQVDEATPLWGARPVWGASESESAAAAEALCPNWEEVEQPPPDLQVWTQLSSQWSCPSVGRASLRLLVLAAHPRGLA